MARAKRIYILIIKVNKLFSFFSSWCFLKEIQNMYSVFLSKHSPAARVPTAFLVLPNLHSCLYNSIETRCFLFLKYCTVLYCTVLYCTVLYCTVLYCTVLYCTVLYCTVLYCTVLYCTVLYCITKVSTVSA